MKYELKQAQIVSKNERKREKKTQRVSFVKCINQFFLIANF